MKYIAPQSWFSLEYPAGWNEFEDSPESFLFYNPNQWTGNFRISAIRGNNNKYAKQCVQAELRENPEAVAVTVGRYNAAYCNETFCENNQWYTTHIWILGADDLAIECTFTVEKGADRTPAENIINSLQIHHRDTLLNELIPIRVLEIQRINEAFETVSKLVKKTLSKDFTGKETDLVKLQELVNKKALNSQRGDDMERLGIVFGFILEEEIEGFEWRTLIRGDQEMPVLLHKPSGKQLEVCTFMKRELKNHPTLSLQELYEGTCQMIGQSLND